MPWKINKKFQLCTLAQDKSLLLHKAILDDNLKSVKSLLRSSDLVINAQNSLGETPLLLSLRINQSSSFIMQLIRAGCNVKISDNMKVTPLHLAITSSSDEIAHELIKRGADINANEEHEHVQVCFRSRRLLSDNSITRKTPLHVAVQHDNLEGVCMLLYYGADTCITTNNNMTALKYAACKQLQDIVKVLIDCYDESYYAYEIANDHFAYEPYRLYLEHEGTVLLAYSFGYENVESTKLFWNKINFESILDDEESNVLLVTFIRNSCFPTTEWLEYLYLILKVFLTRQFTISDKTIYNFHDDDDFFCHLFNAFHERSIQSTTRLDIMNICLSLGAPVYVNDLKDAHKYYGFAEELETLIYANNYYANDPGSFICFILALEENCDTKLVSKFFETYFSIDINLPAEYLVSLLSFFSLPAEVKQKIKNLCCNLSQNVQQKIFKKLDQIPEFPTLLELSRNQARKFVKQTNKIMYPYHFHDAVKKLNFPKPIQDVIRFKRPLY